MRRTKITQRYSTTPTFNRGFHDEVMRRALANIKALKEEAQHSNYERGWRCIHGTYVGDPWGADYLCGACESGDSIYEFAIGMARESVTSDLDAFKRSAINAWIDAQVSSANRPSLTQTRMASLLMQM